MSEEQNSWNAFSLLAGWILANLIGWTTGLLAAGIISPMISRIQFPWPRDSDMDLAYVGLILLGVTIGVAQWTVLRHYLPRSVYWIAATMIGYLLGAIIFALANDDPVRLLRTEIVNNLVLFGLMGTAIGASQWWVLRQRYLNAGLWVLASAFGFLFFIMIVVYPAPSQAVLYLRSAIIGAFAAAFTGVWLVWIIRRPLAGISHQTA